MAGEYLMEHYTDEFPGDIFDWQRLLFVELAARRIKPQPAALAGFMALSGDGVTGENCRLDERRLTAEFGVSRATLYRWLGELLDDGWLVQTRKPTYAGSKPGKNDRKGRTALYRVSWPSVELRHDFPESRVSSPSVEMRFDSPVDNEVVSQNDPSRVAFSAESCLTVTPDDATLPTSDGTTPDVPTSIPATDPNSTTDRAHATDGTDATDVDFNADQPHAATGATCECGRNYRDPLHSPRTRTAAS